MEKYLFDIQLFAEESEYPGADQKPTENTPVEKKPDVDEKSAPKYTDEDVDRILGQKFAAWQKQQEKKISEAERLGKMTEEQRNSERMKALEDKLHGYEVAAARADMMKQGRAMLHDKGINVSDELLGCLIADDADTTKAAVESFITLYNAAVEKAVKDALKGETPKAGSGAPSGMTKEQILSVTNREERQRLMKENRDLF